MYDLVHCPMCGSTEIFEREQDFNYPKGFWWSFLAGPLLGFLASKFSDKGMEYYCQKCGCKFTIE